MNTNKLAALLEEAASKTGHLYSFSYSTQITTKGNVYISEQDPGFGELRHVYGKNEAEVKAFLDAAKPAPSKLDQLKKQRDELQQKIDALSNETFICNKG